MGCRKNIAHPPRHCPISSAALATFFLLHSHPISRASSCTLEELSAELELLLHIKPGWQHFDILRTYCHPFLPLSTPLPRQNHQETTALFVTAKHRSDTLMLTNMRTGFKKLWSAPYGVLCNHKKKKGKERCELIKRIVHNIMLSFKKRNLPKTRCGVR